MQKKTVMVALGVVVSTLAFGQGREDFMRQQAYAEMQRVSSQMDVLQSNLTDLQTRVSRLERGGDSSALRQEVESLRQQVAELRRQLQSQRGEIVRDLSGRLAKMQQPAPAPVKKTVERKVYKGPHVEYVVQSGDTLSLISQAFNTPVSTIKEMNNLKGNTLRVGQKLNLPKNK